jgi:hypothetical protein
MSHRAESFLAEMGVQVETGKMLLFHTRSSMEILHLPLRLASVFAQVKLLTPNWPEEVNILSMKENNVHSLYRDDINKARIKSTG